MHPRTRSVRRSRSKAFAAAVLTAGLLVPAAAAQATPVCTDGYKGGPPMLLCGGRIFPEAAMSRAYLQYTPDPITGFREFQHGLEFLAQSYPRWISIGTLREHFDNPLAVSAGDDGIRATDPADTGDGRDIYFVRITDHEAPAAGKQTLTFSLSVHGNEGGGREGGMRTAEDLAMAATDGGTISDGFPNYDSSTGIDPAFHDYEVADVLAREDVYLIDFNVDGWAKGDVYRVPPGAFARGNGMGTDLNRQMPTVGRINPSRNPLQETEMKYGNDLMREVAAKGVGGLMAYGADIHGELTSNAYVDIMYPAGQFDSIDHRRLMAIAERTKSVLDETLYEGIINEIEEFSGGNDSEPPNVIPTKPAHWATVWDTLGYTDTGFIGDWMATDLAVTGMDYEFFLNHSVPEKAWNVYTQENLINGSRGIIKTAMAYALTQSDEFNVDNVVLPTGGGRAGYVFNPVRVTDTDENGVGTLAGPEKDGVGADGNPVAQVSYSASNMQWFADTDAIVEGGFVRFSAADIAADPAALDAVDTLVLADVAAPKDASGRAYDELEYYDNIRSWVDRGGSLVLTDDAIHALPAIGIFEPGNTSDIAVYLPYTDIQDFDHQMVEGLRPNARQMVDTTLLGWGINTNEVRGDMTVVDAAAWADAGGYVVGTTNGGVSLGELAVGSGRIRVVGGALPQPIEDNDHRYGLRDYAMTYTALYVMENSLEWNAPALGIAPSPSTPEPDVTPPAAPLPATGGGLTLLALAALLGATALRLHPRRRGGGVSSG